MKQIAYQEAGRPEKVGPVTIARVLPNAASKAVGPFLLLDHLPARSFAAGELPEPDGSFAHPHRGIATFTYLLEGALTHADSLGNYGTVTAGGVQWMKAGNGIIHDEMVAASMRLTGGRLHSFQFWINLPTRNKAERAAYMPVPAGDLPVAPLPGGRAELKVLLGAFDGHASPISTYAGEFIWHVRIEPLASARVALPPEQPAAGFLPGQGAMVGNTKIAAQHLFGLGAEGGQVDISNPSAQPLDVLLFGGETITEPLAMRGPFVLNSEEELTAAFRASREGKYGQITYPDEDA